MKRLEAYNDDVVKVLYDRTVSYRGTINNELIKELVKKGAKEEDIKFEKEDVVGGCCTPKLKVTAYTNETSRVSKKQSKSSI